MDEKKKRLCTEHREQASRMALLPHPINQSFFLFISLITGKTTACCSKEERRVAQKKNGM